MAPWVGQAFVGPDHVSLPPCRSPALTAGAAQLPAHTCLWLQKDYPEEELVRCSENSMNALSRLIWKDHVHQRPPVTAWGLRLAQQGKEGAVGLRY